MSDANPYASPLAYDEPAVPTSRREFVELSTVDLAWLRLQSDRIDRAAAIAAVFGVAIDIVGLVIGFLNDDGWRFLVFGLPFSAVLIVGAFGLACRSPATLSWQILAAVLLLVFFPVGTFVGGFALYALLAAKELYGPEAPDPDLLENEFRYRRRYGIP